MLQFMENTTIRMIHKGQAQAGKFEIKGWVKTYRRSKNIAFIELSDGSCVQGLQLVINPDLDSYLNIESKLATGCSVRASGELVPSPAKGQSFEMQVANIELVGECDAEVYPLQKKGHTLEFLREQMHLRPRSNTLGAVFRIRSKSAFAIHKFFQERNFNYVHSPIITAADCEGAGEMFQVTTLPLDKVPLQNKAVDFSQDFFGERAGLTVSGQLEAEVFACSMGKSYTFGPTFRAENSNTTRHLAEFWMIEPEQAFCDLSGNMQLAEDCVKYLLKDALENCQEELEFLHSREWVDKGLKETLEQVVNSKFEVVDYTDAIKILEKASVTFEYPVKWGMDLQAEHEKYLTDQHIKGPAIVINYPKEIKAFYMRLNEDGKTVRAMDVLVPRLGEIIGGSQREERYDVLKQKMIDSHINPDDLWWYLDLRKYGTVPHAGFGLGFERLLMYITGIQNIRDVIPMPRYPGSAKF
jgi:asparaginyl-tRNA synthetase